MRKFKTLFVASMLAAGSLTACGGVPNIVPSGDDDGDSGESLPYTVTEAQTKLKQLGETTGWEITAKAASDSNDSEREEDYVTIGFKNNVFWVNETGAYRKVASGGIEFYNYDDEASKYVYDTDFLEYSFDEIVNTATLEFYTGYYLTGYEFENKTTTTFLGRSAIKYDAKIVAAGVSLKYQLIIDNETGITLKWAAAGSTIEGESGEASFEITSFKTGNQAVAPTLYKNGEAVDTTIVDDGGNTQPGTDTEVDAVESNIPAKFYMSFSKHGNDEHEWKYNLVKVDNTFIFYYVNGNGRITAEEVLTDGHFKRTDYVVGGKTNASYWQDDGEQTSEEIKEKLEAYLEVSYFYERMKEPTYTHRVETKDKTIAGVACQAYEYSRTVAGMVSTSEFYIDPNTNLVFYGKSSLTYNGETQTNVVIDVKSYSTNVTSLFDHACESLMYRENGTDVSGDTHHKFGELVVLKEPTCSTVGEKGKVCEYCALVDAASKQSIPVDPTKHVAGDWCRDDDGNHYHECEECYEKFDVEPHQLPDVSGHTSCSGKEEVECEICHLEVEVDITKSATHTYKLSAWEYDMPYTTLEETITISWHCDCWYLDDYTREGDAGDDKVWVWDVTDSNLFSYRDKGEGEYEVTLNKDACIAKVKEYFPSATNAEIEQFLKDVLNSTPLNGYNFKFTVYF